MCRIHMIRGYNNRVYFAESTGGESEKIMELKLHNVNQDTIIKKEIFQFSGGKCIGFEPDGENIQNDLDGLVD